MVRQPEQTKHDHDGQDELLAVHLPAKLGLPEATQDQHVADDDDGVREDESRNCLKCILEPDLCPAGRERNRCAHC